MAMLIETTKGPLDVSLLRKVEGTVDDEIEFTTWVEYWLGEELVHRSAHVSPKKGAYMGSLIAASLI